MHEEYLSLSTQIEVMNSYKYPIVKCYKGHHYYTIKLFFWYSHLECSDSCMNVSFFCGFYSWDCDWAKGLLRCFCLCDLLVLVFSIVFTNSADVSSLRRDHKLCLHNSLSRMSALSMALQFDEEWNIIWLLKFLTDNCISGF